MKIAMLTFSAATAAMLSFAPTGAKAEDCYWDRAQQARVCHPSPAEREAWRRGREHERHRGWFEHERHPHGWLGDHGYYHSPYAR